MRLNLRWGVVCAIVALVFGMGADSGMADGQRSDEARTRCFALYTVHDGVLKLTAQFPPLLDFDPFEASLEVESNGVWAEVGAADIQYPGLIATFRVEGWDDARNTPYRIRHKENVVCRGVVRANPIDDDEFVVVAMSCNSPRPAHGGRLSKRDLVDNIRRIDPDLLFFAGDQVYDHSRHYEHWLQFGADFGEVLNRIPSVCLPDDHDVGQGNLWGAGGRRCPTRHGTAGGYYMPVAYVQEVERAQTSHLPDPYDPTPVERGIGVYYTHLNWGGVSFAILEDRKFKSAPTKQDRKARGAASHVASQYDPSGFNGSEATLLGGRQLRFLEEWTTDWRDAEMKCVLSQSPFAQMCNYSGGHDKELFADFDSNGWPRSGRDRAVQLMRKSFAVHISGDQHLGGLLQHGVDDWRDANYSFATPAIANFWLRWWDPKQPGLNRRPGAPAYTGDFLDGFGNRMTVLAAANPTVSERESDEGALSERAAGFGVIRFNKRARTVTFECWPRNVDVATPEAKQYPGWPVTISQTDNYKLESAPLLPRLLLGDVDQVVTVATPSGQLISSRRVAGRDCQPATPAVGRYDVFVGEADVRIRIPALESRLNNEASLDVSALLAERTGRP